MECAKRTALQNHVLKITAKFEFFPCPEEKSICTQGRLRIAIDRAAAGIAGGLTLLYRLCHYLEHDTENWTADPPS